MDVSYLHKSYDVKYRKCLVSIMLMNLISKNRIWMKVLTYVTVTTSRMLHYSKSKGKGKVHPRTGHEGPEGEKVCSSTLPSTSALDGGGWSMPRPSCFTPRKTQYPLCRRLGGPQGQSGRVWKISPPPGFDPQTVQPVTSRYTDCTIPAHCYIIVVKVNYMNILFFL